MSFGHSECNWVEIWTEAGGIICESSFGSDINYFLASGDFCILLITFANSLDPDQDRQNDSVSPDLDPNHLTLFF